MRNRLAIPSLVAGIFIFLLSSCLAIAQSSSGATSQSQPGLITFYGPEVFVRGAGLPRPEVRTISTAGYKAPFILHVQNGDENGQNRTSSASVWISPNGSSQDQFPGFGGPIRSIQAMAWINGWLILPHCDFKHSFTDYQMAVTLTDPFKLEVLVTGKTGSKLTVWIEGAPLYMIGPEGGHLEFPNHVVLDVPQGAVDTNINFSVSDLDIDQDNAIIGPNRFNGKLRVLGGFKAKPDGLHFNLPIKATFPMQPVQPGEIPVPLEINQDLKTYRIRTTGLLYDGSRAEVEMQLDHFSDAVVAGLNGTSLSEMTSAGCENNAEVVYQSCMAKDLPAGTKEATCQAERDDYEKKCMQAAQEREYCVRFGVRFGVTHLKCLSSGNTNPSA